MALLLDERRVVALLLDALVAVVATISYACPTGQRRQGGDGVSRICRGREEPC
jgi:hypothetical protein